jgi:membrane-anchored protein YejM (alkaline phosphatase superfamily)
MCCHVTFDHIVFFLVFIGSYFIYIWITLLMYRDKFICCLLYNCLYRMNVVNCSLIFVYSSLFFVI